MYNEYTVALIVPRKKVARGVLADLKSGKIFEDGQEAIEKTKLLLNTTLAGEAPTKAAGDKKEEEKKQDSNESLLTLLVDALEEVGLTVRLKAKDKEEYDIVIVKAGLQVLREAAEYMDYPCKIHPEALRLRAEKSGTYFAGDAEKGKVRAKVRGAFNRLLAHFFSSEHVMDKGARNPYAFLHAPYNKDIEALLVKYIDQSPFSRLDVLKITYKLIIETISKNKEIRDYWETANENVTAKIQWIGIESLLTDGLLLSCFCLHLDSADNELLLENTKEEKDSTPTRDDLVHALAGFNLKTNKVWTRNYERVVERDVANYFGVAVAFYFCFLSHYTRWLMFLSYIGIFAAVSKRMMPFLEGFWLILIAIAFTVWAFLMLRTWKEREARLALRWGVLSTRKIARGSQRATFFGLRNALNPITGSTDIPYFPKHKRCALQRQSIFVICCCLSFAIFNLILCKYLRVILIQRNYPALPSTILNALFVFVLNNAVLGIASRLADRENHQYDHEYEAAVFIYVVVFRIINSFATLFYTAYLKRRLEGSCDKNDDCFKDAGHATAVFFIVQITIGNLMEILPAILKLRKVQKLFEKKEKVLVNTQINHADDEFAVARDALRAEHQFALAEAPSIDVLDDYLEIVVQFGYIALFFVAFPVAPIFAFANNIIEAKVDAIKRLAKRRPIPADQSDISAYFNAFLFIAFAALVNNTALVVFETDILPSSTDIFIKIVIALLALAYFVFSFNLSTPKSNLPYDVALQLDRQAFVLSPESKLVPELFSASSSPSFTSFFSHSAFKKPAPPDTGAASFLASFTTPPKKK